jgi:hypothetical protein
MGRVVRNAGLPSQTVRRSIPVGRNEALGRDHRSVFRVAAVYLIAAWLILGS